MSGPAPAGALVAVVERRGRFLTAEALFPPREPADGHPRRRGAQRLTLGPTRSARGGRIEVSVGDLVLVQTAARGGGARVVRVLGRPDVARDVIEGLMLDRGLSRGFEDDLEREAEAAGERVRQAGQGRRDLRELPTFTIDPLSARDFDDAISAEQLGDGAPGARGRAGATGAGGRAGAPHAGDGADEGAAGAIRVWVHIADVVAHVPEGSPMDREARRRANSVYVPGAVEPMLPHALSSGACSLIPGADRAAVTVELELHGAVPASVAFYRSLIRSDARLDYERVDRIFAGAESAAEPWREPLRAARRAAAALARARERSGALVLDSEEPEFAFDARRRGHRCPPGGADRVPPPDRAPDDRRQRGRRRPPLPASGCRACTASTSAPSPSASRGSSTSSPPWRCRRRRCPRGCPPRRRPSCSARSPSGSTGTYAPPAAAARR